MPLIISISPPGNPVSITQTLNSWPYDYSDMLSDNQFTTFSNSIPYAGNKNFFGFIAYQNGSIDLPDITSGNGDRGITLQAFVSDYEANLVADKNISIYFNEYYYGDAEFGEILDSADTDLELSQIYGIYLITWVYENGYKVTSQLAIMFDTNTDLIIEARNLQSESEEFDYSNYSALTAIYDSSTDCTSIIPATENLISIHDRSNFLECATSFSSSPCIDAPAPSNNPNIDLDNNLSFVFITNSNGLFGAIAGKVTCPENHNLTLIEDGESVSELGYEIHECIYDSDYYNARFEAGYYKCVDPDFVQTTTVIEQSSSCWYLSSHNISNITTWAKKKMFFFSFL